MRSWTTALRKAALSGLHCTGLAALLAPLARGKGVIFTLHSVRPEPPEAFEPNGILKVTPEFLEAAIETVRKAGYDIVSLDEAARRLKMDAPARPFACFTFDDGYRDNRDFAYPVFKRHNLPFAIYVPTAYPDGKGELWWLVLEAAVRKANEIRVVLEAGDDAAEPIVRREPGIIHGLRNLIHAPPSRGRAARACARDRAAGRLRCVLALQ